MKAEQLKSSILQNAIEGKLVEEKSAGNSAKFLLDKIEERKGTNLQYTSKNNSLDENNKCVGPFNIPDSWRWVKLSDISSIIIGKTPAKSEVDFWAFQDYKWVTIADMINGEVIYDTSLNISQEAYDRIFRGKLIKKGTLIMSFKLTIGKTSIMGFDGFHNEAIASIVPYYDEENTLRNYLLKILPLISQSGEFKGAIKGNTLNKKTLSNLPIPLPPLEDQKSIVEKIDEVFKVADKYGRLEEKIDSLNNEFPLNMQKSILQYAMAGKLTSHNTKDEEVTSLLQKIELEKEKLITEKSMKREKAFPPLTNEEIPYDIPKSWKWVRLGEIGRWRAGSTPARSNPLFYGGEIPWLKTGELNNGYVSESNETITQLALNKTSLKLNPIGTVLIAMYGATIGKLGILTFESTTNQACCACIPFSGVYNKFLFYYLMSEKSTLIKMSEGGAQPNISRSKLVNFPFPLPPLEEQERIVRIIEENFIQTNKLKNLFSNI